MKKIIYISILILIPLFLNAQKSPVNKLIRKNKRIKEFTIKNITKKKIFNFSTTNKEGNSLKSSINSIKAIKYVYSENNKTGYKKFYNNALARIKKHDFIELISVNKEGKKINILFKKDDKKIKEVNILEEKSDKTVLINIRGDIDFSQINKFKNINIE
ncbi:MAG: DUF4252 domain-containing protein [Bacteroidales bacterium]|nr:DUF4252 domain-containing protein [Bacteroidales bacterium]